MVLTRLRHDPDARRAFFGCVFAVNIAQIRKEKPRFVLHVYRGCYSCFSLLPRAVEAFARAFANGAGTGQVADTGQKRRFIGERNRILPFLSQEETDWVRRGRNMAHRNLPPHATKEQYRDATALEVLFGFLHLSGEAARIGELFLLAYPDGAENPAEKAENGGDARED